MRRTSCEGQRLSPRVEGWRDLFAWRSNDNSDKMNVRKAHRKQLFLQEVEDLSVGKFHHASQEDEGDEQATNSNGELVTRKAVAIVRSVVYMIIVVIVLVSVLTQQDSVIQDTIHIPTGRGIAVHSTLSCSIFVEQNDESEIQMQYTLLTEKSRSSGGATATVSNVAGATHLYLASPSLSDPCEVRVTVPRGIMVPSFVFQGVGEYQLSATSAQMAAPTIDVFIQAADTDPFIHVGKLYVEGPHMNVYAYSVAARAIEFATTGTSYHNLRNTAAEQLNLQSSSGDIFITTPYSAYVNASNPYALYCFSASNMTTVRESPMCRQSAAALTSLHTARSDAISGKPSNYTSEPLPTCQVLTLRHA